MMAIISGVLLMSSGNPRFYVASLGTPQLISKRVCGFTMRRSAGCDVRTPGREEEDRRMKKGG